jgi:hypothetical protein
MGVHTGPAGMPTLRYALLLTLTTVVTLEALPDIRQ